jgi:NAD(P)H-hydrate epimerase
METAGRCVAEVVQDIGIHKSPVIVLVGLGNNGGDALVAARSLSAQGEEVHVFLAPQLSQTSHSPQKDATKSEARRLQLKIHESLGTKLHTISPGAQNYLAPFRDREPIIIDGVLGIGVHSPIEKKSDLWNFLEEASKIPDATVVAIDVPSGLHPDSGDIQEIPLKADATVTFGSKKPAHILAPARDLCGDVFLFEIGYPAEAIDRALKDHPVRYVVPDSVSLISSDPWANLSRSAHKYDRGHVLIIGGSVGKTGAPVMTALAAMRAGAGWASVSMPESAHKDLRGDVPREVTFERLFDGENLSPAKLQTFITERKVKSLIIGPGMMGMTGKDGAGDSPLNPEVLEILVPLVEKQKIQVTLDAGACHGLARVLADYDIHPEQWVAVPHPGEWSKLGPAYTAVPINPKGLIDAQKLTEDLGCALLYKHATPVLLVGDSQIPAFIIDEGTVSLARAGSGDLLAGIIGAHGARGLSAPLATLRSLVVLAWAGKLAAKKRGVHGVLARDILDQIGRVKTLLPKEDVEFDEND